MLPLSLVTGFLGSGKTSLLQHVIATSGTRRLAFLVNEFGAVDVDGRLLDVPPGRVASIAGGSIFCRCKAGEFLATLRRIADEEEGTLDGVLVEASGIADPRVAWSMFEETGMDSRFDLRSILAVVDPATFPKLLHTLPNVAAQVEACTMAVVNKIDLHSEAELVCVEAEIRRLRPEAVIQRAAHGCIEVDVFDPSPSRELPGELAPCLDPRFVSSVVEFADPIEVEPLLAELRALGEALYRAKGFVPTDHGFVHVDLSRSGTICRPVDDPPGGGRLVVIRRGDSPDPPFPR